MPNRFIDNIYVLKFLRIITRPWKEQAAYKSGVIDHYGNILVKPNKQTPSQKQSYTKFDVMAWNIKRLIEKVPLGKTTIAKYLSALKLLKESVPEEQYNDIFNHLNIHLKEMYNVTDETLALLSEEDGGGGGEGAAVTNTTTGIDNAEVPYGAFQKKKKKKKLKE